MSTSFSTILVNPILNEARQNGNGELIFNYCFGGPDYLDIAAEKRNITRHEHDIHDSAAYGVFAKIIEDAGRTAEIASQKKLTDAEAKQVMYKCMLNHPEEVNKVSAQWDKLAIHKQAHPECNGNCGISFEF
jgi:hypothetical protein